MHSESVWRAREARLTSCRVLSHDAAGFVCRCACRAASFRFGRAGADSGDTACRGDLPGAPSRSGKPASRGAISRAARIHPRKSACRDDRFNAAIRSDEPAAAGSRPREPVHAAGDNDAGGGD